MTLGLPVSRIVPVDLSLAAMLGQAPTIDSGLEVGSTANVIDTVQRIRTYSTIAEVAADFGTTAPE